MEEFLHEVDLLLDWYTTNDSIKDFKEEFLAIVTTYRMEEGVQDIAKVILHNYNCHKYNKPDALVKGYKLNV